MTTAVEDTVNVIEPMKDVRVKGNSKSLFDSDIMYQQKTVNYACTNVSNFTHRGLKKGSTKSLMRLQKGLGSLLQSVHKLICGSALS